MENFKLLDLFDINVINMEGFRPLPLPALTNDLCNQNIKIKVEIKNQRGFDFKILTT